MNTTTAASSELSPRRPRRALLVAFDVARERDAVPSLAIGSILAYARAQPGHGTEFEVLHHGVRLDGVVRPSAADMALAIAAEHAVADLDVIALAAYAWSEYAIDPMMHELRLRGFTGTFVVGGYQVTRVADLAELYTDARYLIEGPAEEPLVRILRDPPVDRVLVGEIDATRLVSPYLAGVIDVPRGAAMVRMETQRGCRWRCRFCSYRGLGEGPVARFPLSRVTAELRLFAERGVRKINVLDAEFNASRFCIDVLRAMTEVGLEARVTVQARPENLIRSAWADEFLDLCERFDIHLEFGLQTAIPAESDAVNRRNDLDAVSRAFYEVSRRGISHEVSLIYGLPLQTVDSFAESLAFVNRHGVPTVRCFPLMLHRGTALSLERERYGMREEVLDEFDIPFVTSSDSFTRADWGVMRAMAEEVTPDRPSTSRVSPAKECTPRATPHSRGCSSPHRAVGGGA